VAGLAISIFRRLFAADGFDFSPGVLAQGEQAKRSIIGE